MISPRSRTEGNSIFYKEQYVLRERVVIGVNHLHGVNLQVRLGEPELALLKRRAVRRTFC